MFRPGRTQGSTAYNGIVPARGRRAGRDGPMAADEPTPSIPGDPISGDPSGELPTEERGSPDAETELDAEAAARRAEDHALIRRAQTGDEGAFAELVDRHRGRAWRVARGLVGSEEDAQDLVQEAFLRVFRSLSSFDFSHGFTTWLYRIVTNLAIDHLRKRRAAISTAAPTEDDGDLDLADEIGPAPSSSLERADLAREVQACLETLAPHFQSVLRLREMEGLACTEIARIVGATHVTVRWRLHRGRKLFQEEWERRTRLESTAGGRKLARGGGLGIPGAAGSNMPDGSHVETNLGEDERTRE